MPQDIEQVFRDAKLSLFPERRGDLSTDCSCPDDSNPCKHIAAVYYLLGEEFDRDPFLIFTLRGLTRDELFERLEALGGSAAGRAARPGRVRGDAPRAAGGGRRGLLVRGRLGGRPVWRGRRARPSPPGSLDGWAGSPSGGARSRSSTRSSRPTPGPRPEASTPSSAARPPGRPPRRPATRAGHDAARTRRASGRSRPRTPRAGTPSSTRIRGATVGKG